MNFTLNTYYRAIKDLDNCSGTLLKEGQVWQVFQIQSTISHGDEVHLKSKSSRSILIVIPSLWTDWRDYLEEFILDPKPLSKNLKNDTILVKVRE